MANRLNSESKVKLTKLQDGSYIKRVNVVSVITSDPYSSPPGIEYPGSCIVVTGAELVATGSYGEDEYQTVISYEADMDQSCLTSKMAKLVDGKWVVEERMITSVGISISFGGVVVLQGLPMDVLEVLEDLGKK